jgi:hypothetical protein
MTFSRADQEALEAEADYYNQEQIEGRDFRASQVATSESREASPLAAWDAGKTIVPYRGSLPA